MKIADIQKAQIEMLNALEERGKAGDNVAAEIFLNQLRSISKDINEWRQGKLAAEAPRPKVKSITPADLDPFA